jgi:hypothetical protein
MRTGGSHTTIVTTVVQDHGRNAVATEGSQTHFQSIEEVHRRAGTPAAFDRLIEVLREEKKFPQLFEAILMKHRHALGLSIHGTESLRELPEDLQATVESCYIDACRLVGELCIENGDLVGAWPYFRAIDEPKKVSEAIERWSPPSPGADPQPGTTQDTDAIVDIAFHQGVHPRRGYELILSQYGTCRAITVYEHQFPYRGEVREACCRMLVMQLYRDLEHSLRSDIERRGEKPAEGIDIRALIQDRPWLFSEHGYHVDLSHLQSVVRTAVVLGRTEDLDRVVQLCEYGRKLARQLQPNEPPPFDDYYNDYRIYLRALAGEGVDGAVRYFASKADRALGNEDCGPAAGEALVHLLVRAGRFREAIAAHLKYLADRTRPLTLAPSLIELSEKAGEFDQLLDFARSRDDLLQFTAGLVLSRQGRSAAEEPKHS